MLGITKKVGRLMDETPFHSLQKLAAQVESQYCYAMLKLEIMR